MICNLLFLILCYGSNFVVERLYAFCYAEIGCNTAKLLSNKNPLSKNFYSEIGIGIAQLADPDLQP
jgi:hypothetical protein